MRVLAVAAVAFFGLAAIPATQAAPVVPHQPAVSGSAVLEIRGGCGPGYYPRRWVDRYGRWRTRCVPYRRYY